MCGRTGERPGDHRMAPITPRADPWELWEVSTTGGGCHSTAELWLVHPSSQHPFPHLWLVTQELCTRGQPTQQIFPMLQKVPVRSNQSLPQAPAAALQPTAHVTVSRAKTWSQLFGQPVRGSFQCICIFLVVITMVSH